MKHGTKRSFLLIGLILLSICLFLFSGVKLLESAIISPEISTVAPISRTLERNGVEYYPRQDITVVLLIGTDAEGKVTDSGSYNNKASADMVSLLVFDEATEEFTVLSLNRDTMLDIPVLGLHGRYAGNVYGQLATSHNYGSGLQDSCENTRKAVSDFLYGLTIDYYFSMNMDGVKMLNDSVGGVEVTVEDDFSMVDPSLKQGDSILLNGTQAYNFVRSRADVGSQLNISRMKRQQAYMDGFIHSLKYAMDSNERYFAELWSSISDYVVTDCTLAVLDRLASDYGDYTFAGTVSPKGENILGDKYYEFYVDHKALDELIIKMFYNIKAS